MKYVLILSFVICSFCLHAQNAEYAFPSPSPQGTVSQLVGNTQIDIEYERPLARKRPIFGDLVPWNEVWRTGAGSCTKIRFDKAVVVEGQRVAAGNYALFTIPGQTQWMVILNADTTLYGSYGYKQEKDIARFAVKSTKSERWHEALTIDVDMIQTNARIYISWADVQVGFDVITATDAEAMKFIETNLLTNNSKSSDSSYEAAQYLLYQKEHLMDALRFTDKAIQLNKDNGAARRVKFEIYEFLQLYKEAMNELDLAIKMEQNKKYEKEQDRQFEIRYWQMLQERIKQKQAKK